MKGRLLGNPGSAPSGSPGTGCGSIGSVTYYGKMVIYWRIVKRLFPAYWKRSVKRDIAQMGDIFFRESPVQKRLRRNVRNEPEFVYPKATPVGINETPRWDG